jgi:hypothetical protein
MAVGIRHAENLAITLPTSGGRAVDIVRAEIFGNLELLTSVVVLPGITVRALHPFCPGGQILHESEHRDIVT